ncbi:MAG: helix-turn-helix transcriptional regulator [Lachnospiraceae bacterium]|nr:helix-turn-helix transcriptional regulator [Lachnospiraceae bacterium]
MFLKFDTQREFIYHWCGKFTSPNNDWIHLTRNLEDYELMVVTEGTLYIADHEQEYTVKKGEYLLMAPSPFQHGTRSGHCNFYWLHFGYNKEQQNHETLSATAYNPEHLLIPATGSLASLERIIILMKQLQDSDRRYKEPSLNRYLCSAILSEISAQSYHRLSKDKQLKEQLYSDILDYISWHIQENLRITEIAAYFGYNEKYLTTFFKQYAGISLKQHILQVKMELAKSSLSETTQPISQIAYGLGFSDAHNFSNAFHKITGLSPSEYRASYNKHNVFQK